MAQQTLDSVVIQEAIVTSRLQMPSNSVVDASISSGLNINAEKFSAIQGFTENVSGTLTAKNIVYYIPKFAATLLSVKAMVGTIATGDYTANVQVQKFSGGSWVDMLSADIVFNSSSTVNTAVDGVLGGSVALTAGQPIRLELTVSGTTGSQAADLSASIRVKENSV